MNGIVGEIYEQDLGFINLSEYMSMKNVDNQNMHGIKCVSSNPSVINGDNCINSFQIEFITETAVNEDVTLTFSIVNRQTNEEIPGTRAEKTVHVLIKSKEDNNGKLISFTVDFPEDVYGKEMLKGTYTRVPNSQPVIFRNKDLREFKGQNGHPVISTPSAGIFINSTVAFDDSSEVTKNYLESLNGTTFTNKSLNPSNITPTFSGFTFETPLSFDPAPDKIILSYRTSQTPAPDGYTLLEKNNQNITFYLGEYNKKEKVIIHIQMGMLQ